MCGISAVISNDSIFSLLYESLFHIQHRGQDSHGFALNTKKKISLFKNNGLLFNTSFNNVDCNM